MERRESTGSKEDPESANPQASDQSSQPSESADATNLETQSPQRNDECGTDATGILNSSAGSESSYQPTESGDDSPSKGLRKPSTSERFKKPRNSGNESDHAAQSSSKGKRRKSSESPNVSGSLDDSGDGDKDEKIDVPPCNLKSDKNYERKILVVNDKINTLKIYQLKHPRYNNPTLYHIDDNCTAEVLDFYTGKRSTFIGDFVSNTEIILFSPIHPFFLVASYACQKKGCSDLDDLLKDQAYPAAKLLGRIDSVKRVWERVFVKSAERGYTLDKQKLNDWVLLRFKKFLTALQKYQIESLAHAPDFRTQVIDAFSDYLPAALAVPLKEALAGSKFDELVYSPVLDPSEPAAQNVEPPTSSERPELQSLTEPFQALTTKDKENAEMEKSPPKRASPLRTVAVQEFPEEALQEEEVFKETSPENDTVEASQEEIETVPVQTPPKKTPSPKKVETSPMETSPMDASKKRTRLISSTDAAPTALVKTSPKKTQSPKKVTTSTTGTSRPILTPTKKRARLMSTTDAKP